MEYNIYDKCKHFDTESMECTHPAVKDKPDVRDKLCIQDECDAFELECPHCKNIIDVDDLWRER